MKKILGILTLFVLLLIPNVFAEELPTISVGSFNAYEGEEFVIPITLENNKGFNGLGMKIVYDTDSLEYLDSEVIGLEEADLKSIVNHKNKITVYALSGSDEIKDNGVIGKITFRAKKDATNSAFKIEDLEFYNSKLEEIDIKKDEGEVKLFEKETINKSKNMKDYFEKKDDQIIKWKSSDEKIATVDESGNVTFLKPGEVIITGVDENDNIIVNKEFKVVEEKKENKKTNNYILLFSGLGLVAVAGIGFGIIEFRKKKLKCK